MWTSRDALCDEVLLSHCVALVNSDMFTRNLDHRSFNLGSAGWPARVSIRLGRCLAVPGALARAHGKVPAWRRHSMRQSCFGRRCRVGRVDEIPHAPTHPEGGLFLADGFRAMWRCLCEGVQSVSWGPDLAHMQTVPCNTGLRLELAPAAPLGAVETWGLRMMSASA